MDIESADYKLSKVKAQLVLEHPFYASLLCNLPFVKDDSVKTMAVDGKNVYYNTEFVESLTIQELKFVEAHEVMHCVFDHMARKGGRNHRRWNVAGDYIINDMLVTDKVGTMPSCALFSPDIVKAGNFTTDGVYKLLPDDGGEDDPLDDTLDPGADGAEVEGQWKIRTVQAGQVAKMAGNLPAGAKRLVDSIVSPKVAWQELLRRFVSKRAKSERSFSRPNRRFVAQGIYLPAMAGEKLGHVVVACDQSGSITDAVNQEFFAEQRAIWDLLRPSKMTIIYFDSEVSGVDEFEHGDDLVFNPRGGGGTAFSPVITRINEMAEQPECVVFLTDLECGDFGDAPDYPVLWVSNSADQAPWGEVVLM